jgi:hypothetical protein
MAGCIHLVEADQRTFVRELARGNVEALDLCLIPAIVKRFEVERFSESVHERP